MTIGKDLPTILPGAVDVNLPSPFQGPAPLRVPVKASCLLRAIASSPAEKEPLIIANRPASRSTLHAQSWPNVAQQRRHTLALFLSLTNGRRVLCFLI